MKLANQEAYIDQIMLDPFNPRFSISPSKQQEQIQRALMDDQKTKDLLNSMQSGITWVNKIVVRSLNTYDKEGKAKLGNDLHGFDYVVVEGNTRLACLKDSKMGESFNRNTLIPIIEAVKEENETNDEYDRQLRRLQGIANVMVVKDWDDIPKAKHVFSLYVDKKQLHPGKSNLQIFKDISMELGISAAKIKMFIFRYMFYREISENSSQIVKDDWKFMEVFESNEAVRKLFGWDSHNSINFDWEKENDEEDGDSLLKQELLYMFPEIMESAKREEISSKKLRDIIRNIYNNQTVEEFLNEMKEVVKHDNEDYSYNNWKRRYLNTQLPDDSENEWDMKLTNILEMIKQYPMNEDWPLNQIGKLHDIQKKVCNLLKYIQTPDSE